jgi:hypothetical protein
VTLQRCAKALDRLEQLAAILRELHPLRQLVRELSFCSARAARR